LQCHLIWSNMASTHALHVDSIEESQEPLARSCQILLMRLQFIRGART
jgi:hypothetical protein